MHTEIVQDGPGNCPVCGMDLVPLVQADDQSNKAYRDIRKKFIIALIFTIPVFILSMSAMLHPNPIEKIISNATGNWLQLIFFPTGSVLRMPDLF